jgi:hypothetical protein
MRHLNWAAITSIAEKKIGCAAETLRSWVRHAERDGGRRPGLTTDERARSKQFNARTSSCGARTRSCGWRRRIREGGARPPSQVMVLRYVPPAEFETAYHDRRAPVGMAVLT